MSSQRKFCLALVQMAIGKNKIENLRKAEELISVAKNKGADVVVLPECFNSPYGTKYFSEYAEEVPNGETCRKLSEIAKTNSIYLVGGSIPEKESSKLYNTSTVWSPSGSLVCTHRKVHLFDIDVPGGVTFRESDVLKPGDKLTVFETPYCKIGLGICYDLRFQEMATLYRKAGADLILYPGAFNMTTGPLHWELLLRARAVDNQIYVAGVCGARDTTADYVAWGHTTLVDPWGQVKVKIEDQEDVIISDIDLEKCSEVRQQIPISFQKRTDLYDTVAKL